MGRVFAARHVALDRTFAVKVLHSDFALDRVWLERFRREARATASIGHENIIDVTDIGLADDGSPYYVMEYLAGEPLDDALRRGGPMPWERVRRIAAQLCDALAAAHRVGVIHRDIKLANIFHSPRPRAPDFVKLLDFGIAKTLPRATAPAALTMTGEVFGTPGYMAPEQFCGGLIDARTDIYALAIALYQLLAGQLPFAGVTPRVIVEKQLTTPPPPLPASVPSHVDAALRAALSPDPEARPPDMPTFARALGIALDPGASAIEPSATPPVLPPSPRSPPPSVHLRRLTILLGITALVFVGVLVGLSLAPPAAAPPRPQPVDRPPPKPTPNPAAPPLPATLSPTAPPVEAPPANPQAADLPKPTPAAAPTAPRPRRPTKSTRPSAPGPSPSPPVLLPDLDYRELRDRFGPLKADIARCKATADVTAPITLELTIRGDTGRIVRTRLITPNTDAARTAARCIRLLVSENVVFTRFKAAHATRKRVF